jgi:ankyrin repeat protein
MVGSVLLCICPRTPHPLKGASSLAVLLGLISLPRFVPLQPCSPGAIISSSSVSTRSGIVPLKRRAPNLHAFRVRGRLLKASMVRAKQKDVDIWWAARRGWEQDVEDIVRRKPNLLNATDNSGQTPLMHAIVGHQERMVRWLVDHGAAINQQDKYGSTALEAACSTPMAFRMVEFLLERGADPTIATTSGSTPLMKAAFERDFEIVRSLLDNPETKTIINRSNDKGETALWKACHCGFGEMVAALLEGGGDPTIATTKGSTPLMAASGLEVVRVLLGDPRVKAIINERDEDGKTALWQAFFKGRASNVRALLRNGADPTIADNDGITPMAIAKQASLPYGVTAKGRRECVAVLEVRSCQPLSLFASQPIN